MQGQWYITSKNHPMSRIFTLAFIAVIFSGCIKTDIIADDRDLVGTWKVTGIRSDRAFDWNGDSYTETDIYSTYTYCQRDIILIFDERGYGRVRQGCTAPWQNLYWYLTNGNTRLIIELPGDDLHLDLVQFNYNTIKGEDRVFVNGEYYTITYTLTRW